jgi:hypothetical protein
VSAKIPFTFVPPATDELELGSPESRDRLRDLLLDQFSLIGVSRCQISRTSLGVGILKSSGIMKVGRSRQSPPGLLKIRRPMTIVR